MIILTRQRKSDEKRKKEGRGSGRSEDYKPWLKIHEVPSEGLCSRLLGWKVNRLYQFMSNLERDYFLITQWENCVLDIREQFPLLPLEETISIADECNIKHPSVNYLKMPEIVMTTDFIITIRTENGFNDIARTIKPIGKMNTRVAEKFKIEEIYWARKNIDWGIVTEENINHTKARNIRFLYNYYFWNRHMQINEQELSYAILHFCSKFYQNQYDVLKTTTEFDSLQGWDDGESLSFFKYLITHKIIQTDMNEDITDLANKNIKWTISNKYQRW